MRGKQTFILAILRNIWLILALGLVLFVVAKSVYTARELVYNVDFTHPVSRDSEGWYPESRISFSPGAENIELLSEPVYLKLYVPIAYQRLIVTGNINRGETPISLGVRQRDGQWDYQTIERDDFILEYDIKLAMRRQNKMEFILSIPEMQDKIGMANNWEFKFIK